MLNELKHVKTLTFFRIFITIITFATTIFSITNLSRLIRSLNLTNMTFSYFHVYIQISISIIVTILYALDEFIKQLWSESLKKKITEKIILFYRKNSLAEFEKLDFNTKLTYISRQIDNIVFGISSFINSLLIAIRIVLFTIAITILIPISISYVLPLIFLMIFLPVFIRKKYRKIGELYMLKTQRHGILHQNVINQIESYKDRGQSTSILRYYQKKRGENLEIERKFVALAAIIGLITNFGSGVAHTISLSTTIFLVGLGILETHVIPISSFLSFMIFTSTTQILQISLIAFFSTKRNYKEIFVKNYNNPCPKLRDYSEFKSLKLENVSLYYENNKVLEDINLEIKAGDKILIFGESGSGKSSILKIFLGTIKIEGKISLNQKILDNSLAKESLFKLVNLTSTSNDFFLTTLIENLVFDEIIKIEKAKKLIKKFNLNNLKWNSKINGEINLSFGESQRVAIIRSLLSKKPILLFDEAGANLDKKNNRIFIEEILKSSATIIVVSHTTENQLKHGFNKLIEVKNGSIKLLINNL